MQKTMKKLLSIILAILMIVTTVPVAFAAESDTEGKTIVITMNDSYGDGWDGNAISVERIVDGEFVLVDTATFDAGKTETYSTSLSNDGIYAFRWIKAFASVECSFEIAVDGEVVYKSSDVGSFEDGKLVYVLCEHNFVQSLCSVCKLECGTDFDHKKSDDGSCAVCGEFIYEITHQPTAAEAYVKLNNSEKVVYQWLVQSGFTETPITDENADPVDNYYKSYYDSELGWFGCDSGSHSSVAYFIVSLRKGDKVTVNIASHSWEKLGFYDIDSSNNLVEVDYVEGVTTYSFEIKKDGRYIFDADAIGMISGHTGCPLTATISRAKFIPIEGETSAELQNPVIGNSYACRATCGDTADVLTTEAFEYVYAISHQPTAEETYVELNEDAGATYKWYKLEGEYEEVTDENASGDWVSEGAPFISVYENGKWYVDEFEGMQFFFKIDLEAGEKLNLELPQPVEGVIIAYNGESDEELIPEDPKKISYTAEIDGCYWVITVGVIDYISAYVGDLEYIPLEDQNEATFTPVDVGMYVCDVTFADGTTEMSEIVDITMFHSCDFSGEWEKDDNLHWKKCNIDGCNKISQKGNHEYTDGKCFCGYECAHESYKIGICEKCNYECPHEKFTEMTNKDTTLGFIDSPSHYFSAEEYADKLFDGNPDTKWGGYYYVPSRATFGYPRKAAIKSYTLVPGVDTSEYPERNWTAWTIYGANDLQGEWTVVHSVTDANLPLEGESEPFVVNSETSYMYYELVVDGIVGGNAQQMADINIVADFKDGRECEVCAYVCVHEGTLVDVSAKAPTCTEIGWDAYEYCTVCDYTTYVEKEALNHKDTIVKVSEKFPTCTESGYYNYEYCTACDYTTYVERPSLGGHSPSGWWVKTETEHYKHCVNDSCSEEIAGTRGAHVYENYKISKAATCTSNAEETGKCICGKTDTRVVPDSALKHSFTKYEVTEEAKCGIEGKKVAACDHGCGETDEKAIEALKHDIVIDEAVAPKCGETGLTQGEHCTKCDYKVEQENVPALGHKDADGDYKCDNGCGHEFEKPAPEEPTPDTPDEPTDEACDHLCHKSGFMGFFWKIVRFFSKLFKLNPVCECGAAHY